jgi:hypothetical protein
MARGDVTFKMTGHKELMSRLSGMDRKMRRSIASKAIRAGQKIMVKALRDASPKASGRGAKAIGSKIKTYKGSQITVGITGERIGSQRGVKSEGKQKYPGAHFHLIEYGTGERFQTGEKAARDAARKLVGLLTPETLGDVLRSTGTFGQFSVAKLNRRGRIEFSRTIREAQARMKRGNIAVRLSAVGRAIRRGRVTGRVRPRPFFKRAFQSAVGRVQAAQLAVLKREIEAAARAA